jgi:hypothetical protein
LSFSTTKVEIVTIGSFIPLLSPVTIPQVDAANENVFSFNLPGKITDK